MSMVVDEGLFATANAVCRATFGNAVYVRGLIEATNVCTRNCLYCGIRKGNAHVARYRLSDEDILRSVRLAFQKGIRSFVVQGGEDPEFGADRLARLAAAIRVETDGHAAITFSFGVFSRDEYAAMRRAGCDRYLLRFETSDAALHSRLRGSSMATRLRALDDLRSLEFEVGSGFMTGLPGSGDDAIERDVALCKSLELDMVGIGPFIPHPATPLGGESGRGLEPALRACALTRQALPLANMPATTAAGSVAPDGRERMLAAGANVVMPNVGPTSNKKNYELYPGKICLDEDGLTCLSCLGLRVATVGKQLDFSRGDSPSYVSRNAPECGRPRNDCESFAEPVTQGGRP